MILSEDFSFAPLISESNEQGDYLTGIIMQAEKVNRNNRLYPKAVLQTAIEKYLQETPGLKLGELNHPSMRAEIDAMQACIVFEEVWMEGNDVYAKMKIIRGDKAQGDKLYKLVNEAGWIPGISTRGLGSLTKTSDGISIVNEGFRLTCLGDIVCSPSAPDAFLSVS